MNIKIISGVILILYFLSIGPLTAVFSNAFTNVQIFEKNKSAEEVSVSDSVSFMVKRPRWYGTIYTNGVNSELYLLNIISLPLKRNGTNLVYIHLFVIFGLLLVNIIIHRNKYKPEVIYA